MSKIYIHVPAVDEEVIGECKYCGTRFSCVPVDIDVLLEDYNNRCFNNPCIPQDQRSCVECKIGKQPFSEYLQERMKSQT